MLAYKKEPVAGVSNREFTVLVFASNIDNKPLAARVRRELLKSRGVYRVDVDLEDWENVIRIECLPSLSNVIVDKLRKLRIVCTALAE